MGALLAPALILPPMTGAAFETYDECVAAVATNPETTIDEADRWARFDGGWPARHCRALALIAAGSDMQGARELVLIATDAIELPSQVRSEMFAHAGQIFLELGFIGEAKQSLDRSLNLAMDKEEALALSAALKANDGDHNGAVRELTKALEESGPKASLLILRSESKQAAGDLVGSRDDATWALELTPENPDAWFRSAQIEAELGNLDGARAAWLNTIDLARGEPIAQAAQINLQLMEAAQ
ncbi:hypothetical protein KHP62_17295 [Rhodobacteraceae bacterium NNCM2]|nr:hypothetical protein [Coraliihabitans acroporae]